jgi:hypothetical protein
MRGGCRDGACADDRHLAGEFSDNAPGRDPRVASDWAMVPLGRDLAGPTRLDVAGLKA